MGDLSVTHLSGGERRRIALAKALVENPDFLILDEPTNHLDTSAIEWLERYLGNYLGTLLLVTHDRYFLDRISTQIVELANAQLYCYDGNYSNYLEKKAERIIREELTESKRQNFLKRELEWVRRGPKARTTKSKDRLDRYYDKANQDGPNREEDVDLLLLPPNKLGNRIVEINGIAKSFGDNKLISNFTFDFERGMRIGLIGPNGVGKTTLLKMIMGDMQPDSGEIRIGDLTEFNYIEQNRESLSPEKTVLEEVGEGHDFVMIGQHKIGIWSYLKRFLFSDDRIKTRVDRLSGGEHNRLLLAKKLKYGGNFLIFDEPTNDLDLETMRILEEAIVNFNGCVIIVSHDRYFLNRVCTGIIEMDKGEVTYWLGDYDYYLKKKTQLDAEKSISAKNEKVKVIVENSPKKKNKLSYKEQQELETIEGDIALADSNVEDLETLFATDDFYDKHYDEMQNLIKKLDDAKERVKFLYRRWEELEDLKEGLK
ncbi:MAG: ATP-binding cassette domain-containing protein, partial [Lentisphaeria bacterium]|nr:ATP-binding cassette domain-containing protein [Lentisphaeria bacterium]